MLDTPSRYPGAQPFSDTELSRRTFFGREEESIALTNQILASRLVVVYAKSGLGKTSMLNAGVAPRLREANTVPLLSRVNDLQLGPLQSIFASVRSEADRQQIEYVEGDTASLWSFFKTVELWRGDLLLTPVLIVDQFEELFTLQPEEARETFLSELGYVVRGSPPASRAETQERDASTPPAMHIVLSLREDFLGLLEDAADRIPQILDHRFRLKPLTLKSGSEAMQGPAAVEDPVLTTRPFTISPQLVTCVLNYLSARVKMKSTDSTRYVEPFHLQLICQYIEEIVSRKQRRAEEVTVGMEDVGGEAALGQTLRNFYVKAVRSVPERHLRAKVRRLCEEYLISPEGRRLSLEEREIQRQLKLPYHTMRQLVDSRLLRSDQRSDSTYYELSHDALVEPVLGTRRAQAMVLVVLELATGGIFSVFCLIMAIAVLSGVIGSFRKGRIGEGILMGGLYGILVVALFYPARYLIRTGRITLKRYRRHALEVAPEPLPEEQPLRLRLLRWGRLALGWTIVLLYGITMPAAIFFIALAFRYHGRSPSWLPKFLQTEEIASSLQAMYQRPLQEIAWVVVAYGVFLWFGSHLIRRGRAMRTPGKCGAALLPVDGGAFPLSVVTVAGGVISLMTAAVLAILWPWGAFLSGGKVPSWLPAEMLNKDLSELCTYTSVKHLPEVAGHYLFVYALFVLGGNLLRRGISRLSEERSLK